MTPEMKLSSMLSSQTQGEDLEKTASVPEEEIQTAMEKIAMADQWGRELAKQEFIKMAALGGFGKAIGTGMKALTTSSHGARMGVGAAVGGLAGAARGSGYDENGQKRSIIGNTLGGAALGAGAGLGAGYGAKALGSMKGPGTMGSTGKYLRGAQKGVSAGNEASLSAVKQMAKKPVAVAPAAVGGAQPGLVDQAKTWAGKTVMGSVDFSKLTEDFKNRTR